MRLAVGLAAVLIVASAVGYRARREQVLKERLETSRELVDAVARDLERRMMTSRQNVLFLSSLDDASAALRSTEDRPKLERVFAAFLRVNRTMLQARLLDLEGREIVRLERRGDEIAAADELQDKSDRYYFTAAKHLAPGEVHVSRIDLNIEHNQVELPPVPVVRFSAVVRDGEAPLGVVVINHDARPLLDAVQHWSERTIGKLVLIDAEGAYLSHPDPSRLFGGYSMLDSGDGLKRDRPELAGWALSAGPQTWTDDDTIAARAGLAGVDGSPQVVLDLDNDQAIAAAAREFLSLVGWLVVAVAAAAFLVITAWRRELAGFDRALALSRTRAQTLAEAAAALAHEVRNPLAAIVSSVAQLRAERSATPMDADSVRLMDIVLSESARLERTLDDFLGLARPSPARHAMIDLKAVAEDVVALAKKDPLFQDRVRLDVEGASLSVLADPDQLRQVLWNLVLNAGAASRKGGGSAVNVRVSGSHVGQTQTAVVEVIDDGPGPPVIGSDRKSPARGGLGLIVASGIVAQHGGQLELRDAGHGTCAVVTLPMIQERSG